MSRVLALSVVLLTLLVTACGGGDSAPTTPPPPPPPAPVVTVQFVGDAPAPLVPGATVQLQVRTLDAAGAVLQGRPVTWASSDAQVASVSSAGLVTGVAPGQANVTATSEGRTGSVPVTVIPPPVASVEVVPAVLELEAGQSATLAAILRDAQGNELEGRDVTWSSSDPALAGVDASGEVTALSPGEAAIVATSEGRTGSAALTVISGTAPRILSIEPAVLVEGETATLAGVRFAPSPGGNAVSVGGIAAEVLSASETELSIRVPEGACLPEGAVPVALRVGNEDAAREHPFRPTGFLELPPGQIRVLRGSDAGCIQLPATGEGGAWLVGIQSTSGTAALQTPIRIVQRTGDGAWPAPAPALNLLPRPRSFAGVLPQVPGILGSSRADEALHIEHLERQAELISGLLRAGPAATPAGAGPAAVPGTVSVGDTVPFRMPNFSSPCQFFPSNALVRGRGERVILIQDLSNPHEGYGDELIAGWVQALDAEVVGHLDQTFGGFTDLDGNGRVVIVLTHRVNAAGVGGFASGGDFFPRTSCPASNEGEFLYMPAPDPTLPETAGYHPGPLSRRFLGTASHELTHVIQLGRRALLGFPQMGPWPIEGQAKYAEQVIGLGRLGLEPGSNLGFDSAWAVDPVTGLGWFQGHFTGLARYFGFRTQTERTAEAPERCGWLAYDIPGVRETGASGPCRTSLNYDLGWSFLDWVTERFGDRAGGREAFHAAFIAHPTADLAGIGALVGEDWRELLAWWAAALYLDDRFQGIDPRLQFDSWNLLDISSRLVETARLVPYGHGFTPFERELTVAAASSAYLRIDGAAQPGTSLRLTGAGGAGLPEWMQLWIVRLP